MKILMIGGTGIISTAVTEMLAAQGHDLHLFCRGSRKVEYEGCEVILGDINDEEAANKLLKNHSFDVVVDWTVFTTEQARRDIRLFKGKTQQYIFIGTASSYQKPPKTYIVTESTPLENPFWDYSRTKTECEDILMEEHRTSGFPVTIVRPSLTYGDANIPYVMNHWSASWTLIDRMRKGKRVIVPGDGTSLWVITHNSDFARGITGLMGNKKAIGEAYHITSDEVLTWDTILDQIAEAAGVKPQKVYISSHFIAAIKPDEEGNLLGDKCYSLVFDNSKIKSIVPDYKAVVPFREGIKRSITHMESNPDSQEVDREYGDQLDRIIEAHDSAINFRFEL